MQVIDSSIVNVALPDMMGNLGASLDEIAWVTTGYILASVIIIPLTGWLGQLFGRKRYFVGSIIVFTAASFFCGASSTLTSKPTAGTLSLTSATRSDSEAWNTSTAAPASLSR